MMTLKKGVLIALEGIDGSGKTTQARLLKRYFENAGLAVSVFKEPTDGPYGQKIRQLAIHGRHEITPQQEFELFLKDRAENVRKNIKPALEKGHLVFMDRYYFSSIAYQGALGLDKKMIQKENEKIAIKPDLVLILDCAPKIGINRIVNERGESQNLFEEENYLNKVRRNFLELSEPNIQIIDSSRSIESVFEHLRNIVVGLITPHLVIPLKTVPSMSESDKIMV